MGKAIVQKEIMWTEKREKGKCLLSILCREWIWSQHRLGHVLIVYSRNTKFVNFIKVTRDTEFDLHTSKQISLDSETWS